MRKVLIGLVIVGVVGLVAYGMRPRPIPVDLGEVTTGPMRVTVDEEGKTRIREHYTVSSPLAGQIRRITLKAGDPLKAGTTVLAAIEPSDPGFLDARSLKTAQARKSAAEASLQQAEHNLAKTKVAKDHAVREYTRKHAAFLQKSGSEQEAQEAEMMKDTREKDFQAATSATNIAKYELEHAEAAEKQYYPPTNGSTGRVHYPVYSPIDGQVLSVVKESAIIVTPGTPLIEVGDPRDLEVVVQVLSSDGVKIRPGASVVLEHWGGEKPLLGRVRRVEPAAFTKISALGVEEQRVNTIVDFVDPPEGRPGLGDAFRVEARIVIWNREDAVKVPASSLFRSGSDMAVYRVENDRAVVRTLKLGRTNALEGEVLEGLQPGDVVVLHPGDKLKDGIAIVPR